MEHLVFQNNAIDMYQTYYVELEQLPKQEQSECRTVNVYHDEPHSRGRPISSICWRPDGRHLFAVTYVQVDFNRISRGPVDAKIWDVDNPNGPLLTLEPPCPILDLQYNPRDVNVLAGALMNGQVAIFDARTPALPSLLCPEHVAHRDAVRSVIFINAKSGMEFFSAGTDGGLKWWDMRNMYQPTDELIVDMVKANEEQSMSRAKSVSAAEFEPTIPTRFMVGTEDGDVIMGNRKGKTLADKLPGKVCLCWFYS